MEPGIDSYRHWCMHSSVYRDGTDDEKHEAGASAQGLSRSTSCIVVAVSIVFFCCCFNRDPGWPPRFQQPLQDRTWTSQANVSKVTYKQIHTHFCNFSTS